MKQLKLKQTSIENVYYNNFFCHFVPSSVLPKLPESCQLESLPLLVEDRLILAKKLCLLSESQKIMVKSMLARAQLATVEMLREKPESLRLELKSTMDEIQALCGTSDSLS